MTHRHSTDQIHQLVRQRAAYLYEYCHTAEAWQYVPFTIDHVTPLTRGGANDLDNMALACFHCNRQKSNQTLGSDPVSGVEAPLFNPRQQQWSDHFTWSADKLRIIGLTPTGRATVATLRLNRTRVIAIRAADVRANRHPPTGDPIQAS